MVAVDTLVGKIFLYRNADRCAAAPDGNNEGGAETAVIDARCQAERVFQQGLGVEVGFFAQCRCFTRGFFLVCQAPLYKQSPISTQDKIFVTEDEQILDGYRLGERIYTSGFRPTFIVGLWRGGSAVGLVVQECLATLGIETDHIALRTSYQGRAQYERMAAQKAPLRVHGKQYLLENLNAEDRLLIVDDVFSSGRHTQAVVDALAKGLKRNLPTDIRVATLWWRPQDEGVGPKPDYFLHKTSQWLVLPYELNGLTEAEVIEHKPFMAELLRPTEEGS